VKAADAGDLRGMATRIKPRAPFNGGAEKCGVWRSVVGLKTVGLKGRRFDVQEPCVAQDFVSRRREAARCSEGKVRRREGGVICRRRGTRGQRVSGLCAGRGQGIGAVFALTFRDAGCGGLRGGVAVIVGPERMCSCGTMRARPMPRLDIVETWREGRLFCRWMMSAPRFSALGIRA